MVVVELDIGSTFYVKLMCVFLEVIKKIKNLTWKISLFNDSIKRGKIFKPEIV
jgi:hypothetical protein